ncbi:hypothetical protein ACROYT_G037304 [Oculina patagonica]
MRVVVRCLNTALGFHRTVQCGSVVNNTLTSPGYPNDYPSNIDCYYSVPIPQGMAMKISFDYFDVELGFKCGYDYMKITNEINETFGVYCGERTGRTVIVTGNFVMMIFHSDESTEKRGFLLSLTAIPLAAPKLTLRDPVVSAIPGNILWCLATGTPPLYTALLRNNRLLVNMTRAVGVRLYVEYNYTCVATNKYGTDVRKHLIVFVECGSVVNNTLKSPGYAHNYAANMDCNYTVPIPRGMVMKIVFHDFYLEDHLSCISHDYLKIVNENNEPFGVYCGRKTGKTVVVTGKYVVMTFHSDSVVQKRGFLLLLTSFQPAPPTIMFPASVVRALPGFRLSCSVAGTPPIYIALIRNTTTLVNTTQIVPTITEKGNYTCVATNKYGSDRREFSVILDDCLPRCLSKWDVSFGNTFECKDVVSLMEIISCVPTITDNIYLSLNNITFLPNEAFANLTNLKYLDLSYNNIGNLPDGVFANLKNLRSLYLDNNNLRFLLDDVFANLKILRNLDLSSNNITFLPDEVFANLKNLQTLFLTSNAIKFLPYGVFNDLTSLGYLELGVNVLTHLPKGVFRKMRKLRVLNLSFNNLPNVSADVLSIPSLEYLYLSSNNIEHLTNDVFSTLSNLYVLDLGSNGIQSLAADVFSTLQKLHTLDLSYNKIQHLPEKLFCCTKRLKYLYLQNNTISSISNETFSKSTSLLYIFLSFNRLDNIPNRTFFNLKQVGLHDEIIMLTDNPIKSIEPGAFRIGGPRLEIYLLRTELKKLSSVSFIGLHGLDSQLNPVDTSAAAITINLVIGYINVFEFVDAMMASGFQIHANNKSDLEFDLRPCPVGTFSNSSSKGIRGCISCPPGGFYSDDVGHVATSCKKCPNGSFVSFEEAPGTQAQDCKSCPLGTETDFFAGYRACKCLEGFYRTHLFEKCQKCGQGGLKCKDDYASLKPGYWWEWRNETYKHRYRDFIRNLMAPLPELGPDDIRFPYAIPTPYMCPTEKPCKGGLDSQCESGYEGPLCAVCSSGYYKQLQTCTRCPTKKWMVAQLVIIAAFFVIIMAAFLWRRKRKSQKDKARPLLDVFFSKLKIVIGFYQVTHGLLEAFSYIKWPDSLQVIGKYSSVLQMDILQIAPVNCLFIGLHVDAFTNLFVIMAINAAVIGFSGVAYGVRKVLILRNRSLDEVEKSRQVSQVKELVNRNVFFFLYVTYLSTCSKTVNVLPLACQELCRDDREELCNKYLKADYSIRCQGPNYNSLLIVAYLSVAYIIALPAAAFITIWRQRKIMLALQDAETSQDPGSGIGITTGLRFLFENYKARSWYWELVEMSRKVILTSGLILVGKESRSYIGLALVIAGMYGMVFSWIKPIQDFFENRLMSTSLAVTVVNLAVGAVSRIPAENIPNLSDPYMDRVLWNVLVIGANTLVFSLIVAQYAVSQYRYLQEWRKNPKWSLSCCLALLLSFNELQGDISGLVETNAVKSQHDAGDVEMPTILTSVEESGAVDFNLGRSNHKHKRYKKKKCHQGTQTEAMLLAASDVVHEPSKAVGL